MIYFLPTTLTGWIELGGLITLGLFAVIGMFSSNLKLRKKEGDDADDRLISLLKDTVDNLQKRVEELEKGRAEQEKVLGEMRAENQLMTRLLQGRDEKQQDFQKQGFESMKKADQILEIVQSMNGHFEQILDRLDRHLMLTEPKK